MFLLTSELRQGLVFSSALAKKSFLPRFKMFKKYIFLAFCLLLSAAPVIAEEKLKVGVITGLSGEWAAYGKATQFGLEAAQKDVPSSQVRYIFEDDQFTPRLSISAFRKLSSIDHVDVVVVGDTSTARALAPEIEKSSIIGIVWASEHPIFIGLQKVIRAWPPLSKEIGMAMQEIKKRKIEKVAVLSSAHDYSLAFADSLEKALGARKLFREHFTTDSGDYRSSILRYKELGVESVALCLNPGQNGLFARQAKDLGLEFKFFGCSSLSSLNDREAAKGALAGAWFFDVQADEAFRKRFLLTGQTEDNIATAAVFYAIGQSIERLDKAKKNLMDQLIDQGFEDSPLGRFQILRQVPVQYYDFDFGLKVLH
jgi:ABC-type branched-subunit amino acid transport system substrate-binding protein